MGWKKSVFAWILAAALGSSSPSFARAVQEVHASKIYNQGKKELSYKIQVRQNMSYAFLSELYTGSAGNVAKIQAFNDNKPLIFNKANPDFVFIQKSVVPAWLVKILDERKVTVFTIDDSDDEEGINNLWEIADGFLSEKFGVNERIKVLLILNPEIDPMKKIVYPGQRVVVPKSLVSLNNRPVQSPKISVQKQPAPPKKEQQRTVNPSGKRKNPLHWPLNTIIRNIQPADRYKSYRNWNGTVGKHGGLDLRAPE
ncbi:hypothetical protein HZB00_02685, partial [Candidatus Woesearchaeota archaeon]|nr:hypothetical protein [Candidatus Woesearchaeota archaeon]